MSRPPASGESGFTVVEAVVAAFLLALAAAAVLTTFSSAERATYRAEQDQVANDVAQRELEKLRGLPYSQLALTAAPTAVAASTDPRSRIVGTTFKINRTGATAKPLIVNGGARFGGGVIAGGTVQAGPEAFTSGDVSGTIQRYIVWINDDSCLDTLCGGPQDFKRVIVAVTINSTASGGVTHYIETQTDVVDPNSSVASNVNLPVLGNPTVAQQFWLSDERCIATGEPAHSATLTSHTLRNTLGTDCGTNPPDALVTKAPTNTNAAVDFATNIVPAAPSPAGLRYLKPSTGNCTFKPTGVDGYKQQHLWVTPRVNLLGAYALTGKATAKLWTRSIGNVSTTSRLCVVLFRRTETLTVNLLGVQLLTGSDQVLTSASPTVTNAAGAGWQETTVPLTISPLTIPLVASVPPLSYERLGIAVGLDSRSGTDQVELNYDNVGNKSRLEVETTTPLGG